MNGLKQVSTIMLLLVFSLSILSACNTIQGVGKDIKKGGEALEKSAK